MKTTKDKIKKDLDRLFHHVMQWYKEHPENHVNPTEQIDCYCSATIGVKVSRGETCLHGVSSATLHKGCNDYYDIYGNDNGKIIK